MQTRKQAANRLHQMKEMNSVSLLGTDPLMCHYLGLTP